MVLRATRYGCFNIGSQTSDVSPRLADVFGVAPTTVTGAPFK
jgi:hypothetical protein